MYDYSFCVYTCMPKEGIRDKRASDPVRDAWELPYCFWELNLGSLCKKVFSKRKVYSLEDMDMIHYRKDVVHLGRTPGEFSKCPIVTLLINRPSLRSSTLPQVALHSRCICNPGAQPERDLERVGKFLMDGQQKDFIFN